MVARAIDLFVTYRFIKLLTRLTKRKRLNLGIDAKGNRTTEEGTNKPTTLRTIKEKNAYTVLHKLVFNIKKLFEKVLDYVPRLVHMRTILIERYLQRTGR